MKKFVINEKQEKELIKRLNEEIYQMPVDKKANKPYCINPDKVLIVKKFLDKTFQPHDYEKIGSNGMPVKMKVVSMNASNGEPLKYMYKEQLHDLLVDRFQNMFLDKNERDLFMKQVIEDWLNCKIGLFGNLTKNYLSENTMEEVDSRANEAELNPTDAQKEAGNYKMGHVRIMGMPISIENPKGSYRQYKKEDGSVGKNQMKYHYGYFTNTTGNGKDGDAVDVFIGPNVENCDYVYVVDQNNEQGDFDESKVMLGFNSTEHAKKAYMANYSADWTGFRTITKVPLNVFKKWLYRKHKQRKPFSDYTTIKKKKITESFLNEEEYNQIVKIAKMESERCASDVVEELQSIGVDAFNQGNMVMACIEQDRNDPYYVDDVVRKCKEIAREYIETHSEVEPMYALRECYLNEEEYNQICQIADVGSAELAEEIADMINELGIYAYNKSSIVYAVIEQDPNDPRYVDDVVNKCKSLAYSCFIEKGNPERLPMLRESLEKEDVRQIGSLTLISHTNGFDWEVYDKDGEYQGKFCGDIHTATEYDIWDDI